MAGVAAQYLQLNPEAGSGEVRRALLGTATKHQVTGPATATPAVLLFTNMNKTAVQSTGSAADENSTDSSGGNSFSIGAVVGIAIATAVGKKEDLLLALRFTPMEQAASPKPLVAT